MNYIESGAGSLIPFVWVSCMEEGSRKKEVGEGMACASREGGNPLFFFCPGFHLLYVWAVPHPSEGLEPSHRACSVVFFLKTEHAL